MSKAADSAADSMTAAKTARLLLLHEKDNVFVVVGTIEAGDRMVIDGAVIVADHRIPAGHKIARCDLPEGAKVFKYGAPIGSTTRLAPRGSHLHTHNMRSDYIATHSREHAGGAEK